MLASTNCTLLAAAASTAFRSTQRFTGTSTPELQDFLYSNGLLVTMCASAGYNCSTYRTPPSTFSRHWSGSWASSAGGGLYPSIGGVIADPHALDIRCLYPVDGGTDLREDNGCGPWVNDTVFGANGASQMTPEQLAQARAWIRAYTQENFPGRSWQDISCDDFFGPWYLPLNATAFHPGANTAAACTALTNGVYNVTYENFRSTFAAQFAAYNGAPVCTVSEPVVKRGYYIEYVGECAWQPTQWQAMVDAMDQWFFPSTTRLGLSQWNEVVATLPSTLADEAAIARAVFYIKTAGMNATSVALLRRWAALNGDMWGGKPILELDLARYEAGGALFTCAEEALVEERPRQPAMSDAEADRMLAKGGLGKLMEEIKAAATRPGAPQSFVQFPNGRVW